MDSKLIGSALLIVGTSIGAGMLALPIATAQLGFVGSIVLLVGCWFVMTMGAYLVLEANLWLPQNSNLISMAKVTLGKSGQVVAWIAYILLLYSLLAAYIAGGSELLRNLLQKNNLHLPVNLSTILFTLFFGMIVYAGIKTVDYANRLLMFIKLSAFILLVILLMPFVNMHELLSIPINANIFSATAITVTITSFGFASIVPSLRIYFAGDVEKLKLSILIGSLIPLICYIFWDAAIMGIIPFHGATGLSAIMQSKTATADLVNSMSMIAGSNAIEFCTKLFTSICVVTSFLGVALCLTDFLADGLKLTKVGMSNVFIQALTFLPPLVIVLFYPDAFITALQYAGIYCVILLMFLPALMVWRGRYHKHIAQGFKVFGGRLLLGVMMLVSVGLIVQGLLG